MELALVAPAGMQHWHKNRRYEMCLPSPFMNLPKYQEYYHDAGFSREIIAGKERRTKYVILDNGMFESEHITLSQLIDLSNSRLFAEVIVPDVEGDMQTSLRLLEQFMSYPVVWKQEPPKTMAVVQGKNLLECKQYMKYIATHPGAVWTLGFPKNLVRVTNHYDARLHLIRWAKREYGDLFQYHALGYNWPGETQHLAELDIRSMDTSAPFVAAFYGKKLTDNLEALKRPPNYWTQNEEFFDKGLVEENIDLLDSWIKGV